MSAEKTILGFRKWKFWLFFFCVFTCLIYFQVLLTSWWTHDNNINSLYSIIFGLDFVTFIIPHLLPFTFTITWYYYLSNCFVCENSEFFETSIDPHTCFIKWQNGMKLFSEDKGNIVCLCKHAKMWYFDCILACYRESYVWQCTYIHCTLQYLKPKCDNVKIS